jgi:hypothetical protein
MVGMEKKCSFLIEGGVQSPALSNGVYFLQSAVFIIESKRAFSPFLGK